MTHTLTLESDSHNLKYVEPFLADVLAGNIVEESRYHNAVIALTEAVNNGIVHGNKYDRSKLVEIRAFVAGGELFMSVSDEGEGFDPDDLPDPLDPENLLRGSGRGVFLIRALTDASAFSQTPTGSLTEMRLRLTE